MKIYDILNYMQLNPIRNEKEHFQRDVELIYMIEESIHMEMEGEHFELKEDDLVVVNANHKYSIQVKQSPLAFRMVIPYHLLCQISQERVILFQCNTVLNINSDYKKIKRLVGKIILAFLNRDVNDLSELFRLQFEVIHELFENFKVNRNKIDLYMKTRGNERLNRALNYINLHYFEPITLSDVADEIQVSYTYLSRVFKKQFGKNFVDYVNDIRIERAVLDLEKTCFPITRIAVDNGFSTPSALSKLFKARFGVTPSEYRKLSLGRAGKVEENTVNEEKINELRRTLKQETEEVLQEQTVKKVNIRVSEGTMEWKNKNIIINLGEISSLSEAKIQEQILYLKNEGIFEYLRVWNFFSDKFMITENYMGDTFNFEYLNRIFDFLVPNNIKLFLDFSNRDKLIMASSDNVLFQANEQHELKNKEEWENLLEHFFLHMCRRYGRVILETWIYEFPWNVEPYYRDKYDYTEAYEAGRKIVKKYLRNAQIAGVGANESVSTENLMKVIRELKGKNIFPDILTMRMFPQYTHQVMDEIMREKCADYHYIRNFVEVIRDILEEEEIECQICISEWSNSVSNSNPIQDSCARGTYIIQTVLSVWRLVDMMGFWHCSDGVDLYYDFQKMLYGGGGILTKDGIKKPSFYAFKFIAYLQPYLLKVGNHFIATRNETGNIMILCFNHKEYSSYYYLKNENEIKISEMKRLFQNEDKKILEIILDGVDEDNIYIIKEQVVNCRYGSIQDESKALDCEEGLYGEEIQYLKSVCRPKIYMHRVYVRKGRIKHLVELEAHEMRLIYIYKY